MLIVNWQKLFFIHQHMCAFYTAAIHWGKVECFLPKTHKTTFFLNLPLEHFFAHYIFFLVADWSGNYLLFCVNFLFLVNLSALVLPDEKRAAVVQTVYFPYLCSFFPLTSASSFLSASSHFAQLEFCLCALSLCLSNHLDCISQINNCIACLWWVKVFLFLVFFCCCFRPFFAVVSCCCEEVFLEVRWEEQQWCRRCTLLSDLVVVVVVDRSDYYLSNFKRKRSSIFWACSTHSQLSPAKKVVATTAAVCATD